MLVGILFTASYIIYFKLLAPEAGPSQWFCGISPEGIGSIGMLLNFVTTLVVSRVTPPPAAAIQSMVDEMPLPRDGPAVG